MATTASAVVESGAAAFPEDQEPTCEQCHHSPEKTGIDLGRPNRAVPSLPVVSPAVVVAVASRAVLSPAVVVAVVLVSRESRKGSGHDQRQRKQGRGEQTVKWSHVSSSPVWCTHTT